MSWLQGHLPPIRKLGLFDPSPSRRPPLTQGSDWTSNLMRFQRLFQRHLFLETASFKIITRVAEGGPAQLLRMIFRYGNVPYQQELLTQVDWKALQMKTPYGNLPALWVDQTLYGDTNAICRHLASHLGLLGRNESERLITEAILAQVEEIRDSQYIQHAFVELSQSRTDDNFEHLFNVMIPKNFRLWEKQLDRTQGPYLLDSGISVADMAIFDFVSQHKNYLPLDPEVKKFPKVDRLCSMSPLHPRLSPKVAPAKVNKSDGD